MAWMAWVARVARVAWNSEVLRGTGGVGCEAKECHVTRLQDAAWRRIGRVKARGYRTSPSSPATTTSRLQQCTAGIRFYNNTAMANFIRFYDKILRQSAEAHGGPGLLLAWSLRKHSVSDGGIEWSQELPCERGG